MNIYLTYASMFAGGCFSGWILELLYRKFFSNNNPSHKWINPGFLNGPYLPLYGFGLCALYSMTLIEDILPIDSIIIKKLVLFMLMAAAMTVIEYIAGLIFIKGMKTKLWDYSNERGNIQGIICPKFSFYWMILSAAYYFLIHPYVLDGIKWITENLAFSFFIGAFFGVFVVDVSISLDVLNKMRKFAVENDAIIVYEILKEEFVEKANASRTWLSKFIFNFKSDHPMSIDLEDHINTIKNLTQKK